jgi:molybdate transport system substrate-binding protein
MPLLCKFYPHPLLLFTLFISACQPKQGNTGQIFAASSLVEVLSLLKKEYEKENPDYQIQVSTAGSQTLAYQIEQGAQTDVFMSANGEHMSRLSDQGLLSDPRVFGCNRLSIIVPIDNPAQIKTATDLPLAQRLVVGAMAVPIGTYTDQVFRNASHEMGADFYEALRANVVSEELNVRLVRAKVILGEADAAVVYQTDTLGMDPSQIIEIPDSWNVQAEYWLGTSSVADSMFSDSWRHFLLKEDGQPLLRDFSCR